MQDIRYGILEWSTDGGSSSQGLPTGGKAEVAGLLVERMEGGFQLGAESFLRHGGDIRQLLAKQQAVVFKELGLAADVGLEDQA